MRTPTVASLGALIVTTFVVGCGGGELDTGEGLETSAGGSGGTSATGGTSGSGGTNAVGGSSQGGTTSTGGTGGATAGHGGTAGGGASGSSGTGGSNGGSGGKSGASGAGGATGGTGGTGGSSAGGTNAGGTNSTGGTSAGGTNAGGTNSTGGTNAGGTDSTGGTNAGGTNAGGSSATGGTNAGGTNSTGGTGATGGTASGGTDAGGTSGGGTDAAGGTNSGGTNSTGGTNVGGSSSTGGTDAAGGSAGSAGSTCTDGSLDGGETGVDCGAVCPTSCGLGVGCGTGLDCSSGICSATTFVCVASTCDDGLPDGDETDVDCGGSCPTTCPNGDACGAAKDCTSGICSAGHVCVDSTCKDGAIDGGESDTDCGAVCPASLCTNGENCGKDGDCASGTCSIGGKCVGGPCFDGAHDGTETDVDCGGLLCAARCPVGDGCLLDLDCASGFCNATTFVCVADHCSDGVIDDGETDTDCGGGCATCGVGQHCAAGTDCGSGYCDPVSMTCATGHCTDETKDADESDTDCGGAQCAKCGTGDACNGDNDCASGDCAGGTCAAASCGDGHVQSPEQCDLGSSNADDPALSFSQGAGAAELPGYVVGTESAQDFYDYKNASAHTGFEAIENGELFFYADPTRAGQLCLFVEMGNKSGLQPAGSVTIIFSNLPASTTVVVSDDANELTKTGATTALGKWKFDGNTDGGVICGFPFPGDWDFTVSIASGVGITSWRWMDGTPSSPAVVSTFDPATPIDVRSSTKETACRKNCTVPTCGDSVLDAGEVCDDGAMNGTSGCAADCKSFL